MLSNGQASEAMHIVIIVFVGSLVLFPVLFGNTFNKMNVAAQEAPYTVMEDTNGTTGLSLYSGRKVHVEYVTSSSAILGTEIDSIQLKLRKVGAPTGNATVGIFDSKLVLRKSFGTINAASVSTSYKDYTFSLTDPADGYILRSGDGVGIMYSGGDLNNMLTIMRDNSGLFDERSTYHKYYTTYWTSQLDRDLYMKLTTNHVTQPSGTIPKYVILAFDDGPKSQMTYAYPALIQNGLRATFFIVCDYASGTSPNYMRWSEVDQLVADGMDIQNHGMTHARLSLLNDTQIVKEVNDCRPIVMQHGSNGEAYALPFNDGYNNQRVVTALSPYTNYAKGSGGNPQLADCGGNCEILKADGTYNLYNRYIMRSWSHDTYSVGRTEAQIFDGFKAAVSKTDSDYDGRLVKVPIITYHEINKGGSFPSQALFEQEMKYLKDNGFQTITMGDITYDSVLGEFRLR